jgi:hypothetical protein
LRPSWFCELLISVPVAHRVFWFPRQLGSTAS